MTNRATVVSRRPNRRVIHVPGLSRLTRQGFVAYTGLPLQRKHRLRFFTGLNTYSLYAVVTH